VLEVATLPAELNPEDIAPWTPMEKVVEGRFFGPEIFRIPREEAPRVLSLLANEGISSSTMFPGYDGVVQGLKDDLLLKPWGL
jgi:hypothetical protein